MMEALEEEKPTHIYRPRGAAWDLFYNHLGPHGDPLEEFDEVLFEGVAGGGKSLAYAMLIHTACLKYPGLQVLMVRKYRDSMSDSCMKTLEEEVLKIHMPEICDGRDRTQRHSYKYPPAFNEYSGMVGTSEIVQCGITDEEKIRSTAWGIIWINEVTEILVAHYGTILTRSRPQGVRVSPYNIILNDCNPSYRAHFINQRFPNVETGIESGRGYVTKPEFDVKRLRLVSNHKDNPTYWDEDKQEWTEVGRRYMAKLRSNPSPVQVKQLYLGLWCSQEGVVYEEFDPDFHIIPACDVPPILYYVGAYDPSPSSNNASVLQIWGIDEEERGYMVAEAHMIGKGIDWWAEQMLRFYHKYRPRQVVCDPSNPGMIELFNNRIGSRYGNPSARVAIKANNDRLAGVAQVKSALTREKHSKMCPASCTREDAHGKARMYFVANALSEYDNGKDNLGGWRPRCTTDELQALMWKKTKDGQEARDDFDPSMPRDGADCTRYFAMFNERRGLGTRRARTRNPHPVGSPAYIMFEEKTGAYGKKESNARRIA